MGEGQTWLAVLIYGCFVLVIILMVKASRDAIDEDFPQVDLGRFDMDGLEILSYVALWCMLLSLIFAGGVDVLIWALKSKSPSVSDLVHHYLNQYPWVGWIVAGLVYHLLVDRPAPPWR